MLTAMQQMKLDRINKALHHLAKYETECRLCPRDCGVDRKSGERGFCQATNQASLSHAIIHLGEEPVLSGIHDCATETDKIDADGHGSGTLFFSGCNLKCRYCQNHQISWSTQGKGLGPDELAAQMIALQNKGALNINLVSPSHLLIPILKALQRAYSMGLCLPLVYNSGGYEKAGIIRHLEGIVDIYLPDLKYFDPELGEILSRAPDYFRFASASIQEMYRQMPVLSCDNSDIAQKGLIVRHLVLPGQWEDSISILRWLAQNCREGMALSLMSQYKPCFKAPSNLQKPLEIEEYNKVVAYANACGFETMFIQPEPFRSEEHKVPDFDRPDPFDWS